jgi:ribosomal protein RSM22 (predicted rRNA methylase)
MWAKTRDTLLIVEPGTPAGYGRIIALRRQLIAAGANVAAPCPHDDDCPLLTPDWCHFTQRLPRSRAHKQLKSAELPYEDEKFSYVALTRAAVATRPARVIAQPVVTKVAVTARLCTDQGILNASAARRQKAAYQRFKKIAWATQFSTLTTVRRNKSYSAAFVQVTHLASSKFHQEWSCNVQDIRRNSGFDFHFRVIRGVSADAEDGRHAEGQDLCRCQGHDPLYLRQGRRRQVDVQRSLRRELAAARSRR